MGKKRKPKLSPEEIMERIIDREQLQERKENILKPKEEEKPKEEVKEVKKEVKWFEKPMTKDKFKVIEHTDNKWYAQYEGWKTNVWIGGYDTEKDVNDVIKSYIKETKKPPMYRNITNVHSVLLDIEKG